MIRNATRIWGWTGLNRVIIKNIFASVLFFAGLSNTAWAEVVNVTLVVENMTCAACPYIVKKTLQAVAGVQDVTVDLEKKIATVTYDDEKTSLDILTRETGKRGYPSRVKSN